MASTKSLIIKLGSQTIMGENGKIDIPQLENLIDQIITLKEQGIHVLLVSSGAVAAGREATPNLRLKFQDIVEERQVLASIGQVRLIEIYNQILNKKGYIGAQILLTKEDFRKRSHYLNIYHLLQGLVKNTKVLPIINENDVTSINELMFTDNDELSSLLAVQMHVDKLIILTSVDGVYDRPPNEEGAKILSTLDLNEKEAWPILTSSKTILGRGGMLSKLASARKAAHFGIHTHIANARIPNVLPKLVLENNVLGTTILPFKQNKGIKRWLFHAVPTSLPAISINEGISTILSSKLKAVSLLPVGITAIAGEFEKGDLVSILSHEGVPIGLGIAGYDSKLLSQALGKKEQKAFMHYNKISIYDIHGVK